MKWKGSSAVNEKREEKRQMYIYIYFFYLRFFKNGFQSAHPANRLKKPHRLGDEPKNPRRRVERNGSTRENLRGYNLTSSLDFNASSRGRFEPLWFSSSHLPLSSLLLPPFRRNESETKTTRRNDATRRRDDATRRRDDVTKRKRDDETKTRRRDDERRDETTRRDDETTTRRDQPSLASLPFPALGTN